MLKRGEEEEEEANGSLSFRMESPERISAAVDSAVGGGEGGDSCGGGDDGFEFSFVRIPEAGPPIAADDIFSDGKIRPIYPVFNRDLLLVDRNFDEKGSGPESGSESKPIRVPLRRLFVEEEKEQASFSSTSSSISSSSSASSSMDELDGIPPGTYCVWTPPASKISRCKKSSSTGSSSPPSAAAALRWRLRDLVVGRSQSEGRAKFVFIPIREEDGEDDDDGEGGAADDSKRGAESNLNNNKLLAMKKLFLGKKLLGKSAAAAAEVDVGTTQPRAFNGQRGQDFEKAAGSSGRRSYMPYKQDLVGLFASVNARSQH